VGAALEALEAVETQSEAVDRAAARRRLADVRQIIG